MQSEFVLMFMQFLGILFIIFLAYVGTKWISKKYSKLSRTSQMKVLERMSLGQDKSIVLVLIGKKTYLLGVSSKGIETLQHFEDSDFTLPQEITNEKEKAEFSGFLNDFSKKCNDLGSGIGDTIGSTVGTTFAGNLKDYYIKNGRN